MTWKMRFMEISFHFHLIYTSYNWDFWEYFAISIIWKFVHPDNSRDEIHWRVGFYQPPHGDLLKGWVSPTFHRGLLRRWVLPTPHGDLLRGWVSPTPPWRFTDYILKGWVSPTPHGDLLKGLVSPRRFTDYWRVGFHQPDIDIYWGVGFHQPLQGDLLISNISNIPLVNENGLLLLLQASVVAFHLHHNKLTRQSFVAAADRCSGNRQFKHTLILLFLNLENKSTLHFTSFLWPSANGF